MARKVRIQVEGVAKYTSDGHTHTHTLSDGDGGKQGAESSSGQAVCCISPVFKRKLNRTNNKKCTASLSVTLVALISCLCVL